MPDIRKFKRATLKLLTSAANGGLAYSEHAIRIQPLYSEAKLKPATSVDGAAATSVWLADSAVTPTPGSILAQSDGKEFRIVRVRGFGAAGSLRRLEAEPL